MPGDLGLRCDEPASGIRGSSLGIRGFALGIQWVRIGMWRAHQKNAAGRRCHRGNASHAASGAPFRRWKAFCVPDSSDFGTKLDLWQNVIH